MIWAAYPTMHLTSSITIPAIVYEARCLFDRRYATRVRRRVQRDVHLSVFVLLYGLLLLYYLITLGAAIRALSQSSPLRLPRRLALTLPPYTGGPTPSPLMLLTMAVAEFDHHGSIALERHGDLWLQLQNWWVWFMLSYVWSGAVRRAVELVYVGAVGVGRHVRREVELA